MIVLIVSAFAAEPAEAFRPEYDAYGRCVENQFRRRSHQIASFSLLREMALPHCRLHRECLVERIANEQLSTSAVERRRSAEKAVVALERLLPSTFRDTVQMVPASECSTGLKVKDWCLE